MPTPPPPFAVVALLTSDSYLPGVLTTLHSLLDLEPPSQRARFDTVCLVTPATVGHQAQKALDKAFDHVVGVEPIASKSLDELKLLGRRDLALTLTKLHLFRLTKYQKILFLDADTLVLRPLSHLFDLPVPFAAAPDQGWPDSFNSGVFVAEPSKDTFEALVRMMRERGTWDGGDQGLLNDFFPNWHRLSFTYNVTPSAYYTYAPAYKRHGQDISVLHFIGTDKPWKRSTRSTYDPEAASKDYYGLVGQWFDVFERHYGTISTWDVASRVRQPPTFKSSFTTLPALEHADQPSLATPPPTSPIPTIAIAPPESDLPPPVPIVAPSFASRAPSPAGELVWDPSRSSPPRNGPLQMRTAIPVSDYTNAWDDPSAPSSRKRFEPPARYPSPPRETHDWYKAVMAAKPDPSAVKPVFPWEEPAAPPTPSGRTPPAPSIPPPTRTFSDELPSAGQAQAPSSFRGGAGFTNAWDAVPGIKRYADQLAKRGNGHGRKASGGGGGGSGSSGSSGARTPSHGRRRSGSSASGGGARERGSGGEGVGLGLKGGSGKKGGKRDDDGDASSRDGDDEDDEDADVSTSATEGTEDDDDEGGAAGAAVGSEGEGGSEDSEERDRIKIRFRRQPSQSLDFGAPPPRSTSSSSPEHDNGGFISSGQGGTTPKPRKDSRYVPTSPRQPRSASGGAGTASPSTSPYLAVPSPNGSLRLQIPSGGSPSSSPSAAGPISPSKAGLSPRAQALRASTHARLVASGSGGGDNAPPVVRATRVFRPETDTGVVKQQGLAALQRFVANLEAAQAGGAAPQQQQ
ncbi:hypothetical protein JCM8097_001049 [Rhodosporidiobolus ruineniae]